jgi:hypothetical protein
MGESENVFFGMNDQPKGGGTNASVLTEVIRCQGRVTNAEFNVRGAHRDCERCNMAGDEINWFAPSNVFWLNHVCRYQSPIYTNNTNFNRPRFSRLAEVIKLQWESEPILAIRSFSALVMISKLASHMNS